MPLKGCDFHIEVNVLNLKSCYKSYTYLALNNMYYNGHAW